MKYGSWGNALITNVSQFNQLLPYINGFNYRFPWRYIETAPDVFDWATFDAQLDYMFNNNLQVGFMMWSGPDAPIVSPSTWLKNAPYNVPTFTNDRGTFPYYLNATYKTRFYNMLDKTLAHIEAYPQWKKDLILFWMGAEGSTGDEGPYKGTVPAEFQISDADWNAYKQEVWEYMYAALASSSTRWMINPSNDGQNYQYSIDTLPTCFLKAGSFSHTYSNYGDLQYANRLRVFRTYPSTDKRIRGEFEFTGINSGSSNSWWIQSATQNFFALCASCIHSAVDMINIASSTAINYGYTANPSVFAFFSKYAGLRTAAETNVAMTVFRDVIDLNDTTRFPVGTYGAVVTQNVTQYNNSRNAILASSDPDAVKDTKLTNLLIRTDANGQYLYLNPSRIAAIRALFPNSSYRIASIDDQSDDKYNQDYGVDLDPGNYQLFMTQYSPNTTSVGYWRVGSKTQYFGRYARGFDYATGKTEMFLTLDTDLDYGNADGNNVTISLTYYDSGTAIWGLNVYTLRGREEVIVRQNTNTNQWLTASITLDGFLFGGNLPNSSDITIKLLSPDQNAIFSHIEFQNNSK